MLTDPCFWLGFVAGAVVCYVFVLIYDFWIMYKESDGRQAKLDAKAHYDGKYWDYQRHGCPNCGSHAFMQGPQGACSENIKCGNTACGSEFNMAGDGTPPGMFERIHRIQVFGEPQVSTYIQAPPITEEDEVIDDLGAFRICDPMWVAGVPCPHCGAQDGEYHHPPEGKPIYGP